MMRSKLALLFFIPAILPFILIILGQQASWVLVFAAVSNFIVCFAAAWLLDRYLFVKTNVQQLARDLRFTKEDFSDINNFDHLFLEVRRRTRLLSSDLLQQSLSSSEDLSESVHRILSEAFVVLDIESAEIALRDSQSGLFHSSFSVGYPFKTELVSSNETLVNDNDASVAEPLLFSGMNLGMLRVAFKDKEPIKKTDFFLLKVLALQSALSILNSKYTEELLRMKQTSEDSVRAKTGFLANLSHEIRGPLGTILNAAELVVEGLYGPVSEDQKETLMMIQNNGKHLLDLINDVLDYSKIESGKIVPKPEALNVSELLSDVSAVVRSQAVTKKHKLEIRPCPANWFLTCDRRHLRQMLINLLTNAIKYTPNGGKIEIWAEALQGRIRINVLDNGIGMDKEDHYKVFSAFERIENDYTRNQIGTGLGMPLTKRMADVNLGTLDFTSEVGKGSHFFLTLPSASEDEFKTHSAIEDQIVEARGNAEIIYILDSDQHEAEMLSRYLAYLGFVPKSFSTVEEVLDSSNFKPRLVLISNSLLEDGLQATDKIQKIRASCGLINLPIVLISSRAFSFDIEEYLRQGVDYCISKPIELKKVGIICRNLIDGEPIILDLNT